MTSKFSKNSLLVLLTLITIASVLMVTIIKNISSESLITRKSDRYSTEKRFLLSMIPHHEEAVETSQFVLAQTKDSELHNFLTKVISAQTAEIEQMKASYTSLFGEEYKPDGTYAPMMQDLQSLSGDKLEKTYVQGMILHHQGALDMAKPVAELGESSTLSPFAQKIIDTQTAEVLLMQGWLEKKYGQVQIEEMQQHMMH